MHAGFKLIECVFSTVCTSCTGVMLFWGSACFHSVAVSLFHSSSESHLFLRSLVHHRGIRSSGAGKRVFVAIELASFGAFAFICHVSGRGPVSGRAGPPFPDQRDPLRRTPAEAYQRSSNDVITVGGSSLSNSPVVGRTR